MGGGDGGAESSTRIIKIFLLLLLIIVVVVVELVQRCVMLSTSKRWPQQSIEQVTVCTTSRSLRAAVDRHSIRAIEPPFSGIKANNVHRISDQLCISDER